MPDKEQLYSKIRKLMALSTSPNEHEAALALERAQALLTEHNLTMAEVASAQETKYTVDSDLQSAIWCTWVPMLYTRVAKLFFCGYISSERGFTNTHLFVGEEHNVVVAKLIGQYLLKAVTDRAMASMKSKGYEGDEAYYSSFCHGACYRLCERIEERLKEPVVSKPGKLPAVRSMYLQTQSKIVAWMKANYQIQEDRVRIRGLDSPAVNDGIVAGDDISLDTQVGGPKSDSGLLGKRHE